MINPLKALLFLAGGTTVAGVGAYVSGALDPYFNPQHQPPAAVANLPAGTAEPTVAVTTPDPAAPKEDRVEQPANAGAPTDQAAAPTDQAAATPDQPAAGADTQPTTEQQPQAPEIAALDPQAPAAEPQPQAPASAQPDAVSPGTPTFDIVRVEPDGSVVIAGRAAANATIELLTGGNVIGTGKAGAGGEFVIVLDKPLAPGDYEITIRATNPDSTVVASAQTAIVSVPKEQGGAVLAMVEEPGKPSEIITVPEPTVAAADAKPAEAAPAAPEPDATKPADTATAAADPAQPGATAEPAKPAIDVAVEAVEIEGRKIFVAGRAPAGVTVRAYADDDALGEAKASPAGRFLVEAQRELAVGNHVVRVDVLGPDGVQVIARAAVPFEREAGENVAAVAAPAGETQSGAAATTDQPAATTAAPAATAETAKPGTDIGNGAPAAAAEQQPATGEQVSPPAQAPAATADAPAATPPADAAPADTQPAAVAAATPPADGVTAPALQNVKSAVIIRRGDSLWRISKRVYGRGVRYSTIYLANQDQIRDPDMIWPGQVFTVPNKTDEGEAADMTRVGEQATSKTE